MAAKIKRQRAIRRSDQAQNFAQNFFDMGDNPGGAISCNFLAIK